MEATIKKTWKPTTGGILNIITGSCHLLGALGVIIALLFIVSFSKSIILEEMWNQLGQQGMGLGILIAILVCVILFMAIIGTLSLVGGIYALKRKMWGLALTGSIASMFGSTVIGILAIIFIAMSKDEFV